MCRAVREFIAVRRVIYPGNYLHQTPSLVLPRVCNVDSVKGIGAAMQPDDPGIWLDAHKEYTSSTVIMALETAYGRIPSTLFAGFGLMTSLNAGAISHEGKWMLAPGADLPSNARRHDSSRANVGVDSTLVAAFDADGIVEDGQESLREYIVTKQGPPLPRAMSTDSNYKKPEVGQPSSRNMTAAASRSGRQDRKTTRSRISLGISPRTCPTTRCPLSIAPSSAPRRAPRSAPGSDLDGGSARHS